MANLNSALPYLLTNEGGFVDEASDKGGATNCGITLHTLSVFRGVPSSVSDLKALTSDTIGAIYKKFYWSPLDLDSVASQAVATAIFDVGVNLGGPEVIKLVQTVLRVDSDGHMGPKTLEALNGMDFRIFLREFISLVQDHYLEVSAQPGQAMFLAGWLHRSQRLMGLMV